MTTMHELMRLERLGWESPCNSTGAGFYGSLMTDAGAMVLANGIVLDKAGVIASLNDSPPWRDYEIADERVISIGDSMAILVYTDRASRDDDKPEFVAVMATTYVRDESGWRLALYRQTPVPTTQS